MIERRRLISAAWVFALTGSLVAKTNDKQTAAHEEVKRLLLMMDTDQNGKVSKKEFMSFMDAEFDRLDTDKSGELDLQELTKMDVRVHGGPHR
jgi:Ca2+-binding EF-hand superfamily protein